MCISYIGKEITKTTLIAVPMERRVEWIIWKQSIDKFILQTKILRYLQNKPAHQLFYWKCLFLYIFSIYPRNLFLSTHKNSICLNKWRAPGPIMSYWGLRYYIESQGFQNSHKVNSSTWHPLSYNLLSITDTFTSLSR